MKINKSDVKGLVLTVNLGQGLSFQVGEHKFSVIISEIKGKRARLVTIADKEAVRVERAQVVYG